MSKITISNLQSFIDLVEYDYASGVMMFSTNLNGYMIPISMVHIKLEPTDTYFPANLFRLEKMYGITDAQVLEGIQLCKITHGYS